MKKKLMLWELINFHLRCETIPKNGYKINKKNIFFFLS